MMHTALATALLFGPLLSAGDPPEWGGFRGTDGTGLVPAAQLPASLDLEAQRLWRAEVPPGFSSPTVAGERVFLTAAEPERKKLITLCLDRATGETRWTRELDYDGERIGANSAAAPSPTTDGERVYALFHSFGLVVYDLEGKELWRRPMDPPTIPHGISSSPVVHDGVVVLLVDQDIDPYLVALDGASGEERWKVDRKGVVHAYTTPALYQPDEGPAQVIVSGSFQIAAYSLADGQKLWWVDGACWQPKAVPVVVGDRCYVNSHMGSVAEMGLPRFGETFEEALEARDANGDGFVGRDEWDHPALQQAWFIFDLNDDDLLNAEDWAYAQSSVRATGGIFALDLGGSGDVTESHLRWMYDGRRGIPHIPSPVVVNGTLFTISRGSLFASFDPEKGEPLKTDRVNDPDEYYASPIAAGTGEAARILTVSKSGLISVLSAQAEWEVLATANLDEIVWSTPALAGDQIFVRSLDALHCFGPVSEEEASAAGEEEG